MKNKLSREYAEDLAPKIPVIWKKSDSDTDKVNKGIVAGYMACAEHARELDSNLKISVDGLGDARLIMHEAELKVELQEDEIKQLREENERLKEVLLHLNFRIDYASKNGFNYAIESSDIEKIKQALNQQG